MTAYLVDGDGQVGGRGLADVVGAARCRVTFHDGENLQVAGGRGQVEVRQPGLLQVVEVSLGQRVPEDRTQA